MKKKKILVGLALFLCFILFIPAVSFANSEQSNITKVEDDVLQTTINTKEIGNDENISIQSDASAEGLIGGGTLSCKGDGYSAALCNISLTCIDPISYGEITITYYKVNSNGSLTNVGYHVLTQSPKGSTRSFYDQDSKILPSFGKYRAKASGYY